MALFVHKYGGSSVADAEKIINVARRIAGVHDAGDKIVTVVSAMGDTTDELIWLAPCPPNRNRASLTCSFPPVNWYP